jgi:hypothetical protein
MDLPEQKGDTRTGKASRLLTWLLAVDRWASGTTGSGKARRLLVGTLVTLTLAIFAWSIYQSWDTLVEFEWQFAPQYLGLSFLCYTVALSLSVLTWHRIVVCLKGPTSLRVNIRLYLYSATAKRLPGFIWYVGSRLYLYRQEGTSRTTTSVGLLLETTFMILSGVLVFLSFMPFSQVPLLAGGSPWFLLGIVPLLAIAFQPSLLVRLLNFALSKLGWPSLDPQIRWSDSVLWLAQYAANWVAGGLTFYTLTWAIHPLPASALPGVIAVVALTGVLRLLTFFLPGGWGIQEVSLSLGLLPFLPLPIALAVPLVFRLWLIAGELAWVALATAIL